MSQLSPETVKLCEGLIRQSKEVLARTSEAIASIKGMLSLCEEWLKVQKK